MSDTHKMYRLCAWFLVAAAALAVVQTFDAGGWIAGGLALAALALFGAAKCDDAHGERGGWDERQERVTVLPSYRPTGLGVGDGYK